MPDDQVTIDPEFRPPQPNGDQSGRLKTTGVVGVVIAAFAFGWLMRSPEPLETDPDEALAAASITSTTAAEETESSTTTQPSTTTTSAPPEPVWLGVPLDEAVPGFTDTITMEQWTNNGVDVARWRPSQPVPETYTTLEHDDDAWFAGLDASATWYALQGANGVVSVHRLGGVDIENAWLPDFEAVGVRVASLAWHDTEAGQLSWLSCSRLPGGPGTLFRLDVATGTAEPVAVRTVEEACSENSSAWLSGWGDSGFVLSMSDDETHTTLLIDADGKEIVQIGDGSTNPWVISSHSNGTIWAEDVWGPQPSWLLLSPNGKSRTPVPGLAEDEWLQEAQWSPDGARLALYVRDSSSGDPTVRLVDVLTASTVTELAEPGEFDREIGLGAWSTDSRFFVFPRFLCPDGCQSAEPQQWELVFLDTASDTATVVSLPSEQGWGGIWLTDPATPAALVAHYPFDGDSTDLSEHDHDGARYGPTPTTDRFGTSSAAYAFDGENDRIAIEMRSQLRVDTVSITAWVKMDDGAAQRPVEEWWDIVSYGDLGHVLAINGEGAVLGGLQNTGIDCEFTGSDTVFDGGWHHVAMTRDANWVIRVYLDGVVQATTPHTLEPTEADATTATCATAPEFPDSVWIGFDAVDRIGFDPVNREYFHGSIDDVRIYSGVLSDEEIAAFAADAP